MQKKSNWLLPFACRLPPSEIGDTFRKLIQWLLSFYNFAQASAGKGMRLQIKLNKKSDTAIAVSLKIYIRN